MKNKIFGFLVLTTLAVVTTVGINQNEQDSSFTLLLKNAEALATPEGGIEQIKCNAAVPVVCIILNNETVKGEKY